jgi:hypothetical protein
MRDFYMIASSTDSIEYFDKNHVGNFRIKVEKTIHLQHGEWYVGLCEIHGTLWDVEVNDTVYVLSNLSNGILVPSNKEGVLRGVNIRSRTYIYYEYKHRIYIPVQTHFIDMIEFSLKVNGFDTQLTSRTSKKTSLKPRTWCVLHFKRKA